MVILSWKNKKYYLEQTNLKRGVNEMSKGKIDLNKVEVNVRTDYYDSSKKHPNQSDKKKNKP